VNYFAVNLMGVGVKNVTLEAEGAWLTERHVKTCKEDVDKDINVLHIKPSDDIDWREMAERIWMRETVTEM